MNRDNAHKGTRLSTEGIAYIVARLGEAVGLRVRPHGLRHAGITAALDLSGGNMRAVRRFSRHKDPRTFERYDNREDLAGQIAALVGAASVVK